MKSRKPARRRLTKKSAARKRPSKSSANKPLKNIDEYLALVPEPGRSTLETMRAVIRAAAPPESTEVISYRIPAFKYKEVLVWFAAFSDHCSFFPTASVIEQFKDDLKPYHLSKGTIQFPIDKPLPAPLVRRMVEARLHNVALKRRG